MTEQKGFFPTLFDFNFKSFLTIKFIKLIYVIVMGLTALVGLLLFFMLLATGEGSAVALAILVVPAVTLLYIVIARIALEAIVVFFRIGENTSLLVKAAGLQPSALSAGQGGPVPAGGEYGPPQGQLPWGGGQPGTSERTQQVAAPGGYGQDGHGSSTQADPGHGGPAAGEGDPGQQRPFGSGTGQPGPSSQG